MKWTQAGHRVSSQLESLTSNVDVESRSQAILRPAKSSHNECSSHSSVNLPFHSVSGAQTLVWHLLPARHHTDQGTSCLMQHLTAPSASLKNNYESLTSRGRTQCESAFQRKYTRLHFHIWKLWFTTQCAPSERAGATCASLNPGPGFISSWGSPWIFNVTRVFSLSRNLHPANLRWVRDDSPWPTYWTQLEKQLLACSLPEKIQQSQNIPSITSSSPHVISDYLTWRRVLSSLWVFHKQRGTIIMFDIFAPKEMI